MVFESFLLWAQQYISEVGYFAVFAVSAVLTSTIFITVPGGSVFVILFAVSAGLSPLLVGIMAGLGSATGELTGYMVGFGSTAAIEKYEKRVPRIIKRMMGIFKNVGFWLIFLVALLPLPFDAIGFLSGMSQYNLKKFYAAVILGRTIRSLLIAYGGYSVFPAVKTFFD